ncbi:anti-sigma factor [Nocardia camponoti]|uniref:Anti-sigma factor n=1 Tax=Nocardia camponoti TaxID=1616106 RepID=A0A917V3R9_9NOCA|nr:anti-sigma factor [Nocardia camponoti]GGK32779.1 hypothetical protein GCM10011591_00600 [Nocardia camponoti]
MQAATVRFEVPAALDHLTMAHAMSETMLLVNGFALDVVVDLMLALDEVVTTLMRAAVPDTAITCAFTTGAGTLDARVSNVAQRPAAIDENSFGWHVVASLTDTLSVTYDAFDNDRDGYPTTIYFGWIHRGQPH